MLTFYNSNCSNAVVDLSTFNVNSASSCLCTSGDAGARQVEMTPRTEEELLCLRWAASQMCVTLGLVWTDSFSVFPAQPVGVAQPQSSALGRKHWRRSSDGGAREFRGCDGERSEREETLNALVSYLIYYSALPIVGSLSLFPGQSQWLAGALSPPCGALQQPGRCPPVGNSAACKRQLVGPLSPFPSFYLSLPAPSRVHTCCLPLWPCPAHRCVVGRAMTAPRPPTASAGPPSPEGATRWWSRKPPSSPSATCCRCSPTSCWALSTPPTPPRPGWVQFASTSCCSSSFSTSSWRAAVQPLAVLLCPGWEKVQLVYELLEDTRAAAALHPATALLGVGKDEAKTFKMPKNCESEPVFPPEKLESCIVVRDFGSALLRFLTFTKTIHLNRRDRLSNRWLSTPDTCVLWGVVH